MIPALATRPIPLPIVSLKQRLCARWRSGVILAAVLLAMAIFGCAPVPGKSARPPGPLQSRAGSAPPVPVTAKPAAVKPRSAPAMERLPQPVDRIDAAVLCMGCILYEERVKEKYKGRYIAVTGRIEHSWTDNRPGPTLAFKTFVGGCNSLNFPRSRISQVRRLRVGQKVSVIGKVVDVGCTTPDTEKALGLPPFGMVVLEDCRVEKSPGTIHGPSPQRHKSRLRRPHRHYAR
jgi:hypothetical protein